MWEILFTKNAEKDKRLLKQAGLDGKSKEAKLKNEKTELLGFSMTSQFQNARSMETEKTSGSRSMKLQSLDCKTRSILVGF